MNIKQYIKLTKSLRQSHVDLKDACINNGKRMEDAKDNLLSFHNIENFSGLAERVDTCHLCINGSTKPNGFICQNPKHMYFGTRSENNMDKPKSVRIAAAKKASSFVDNKKRK